ncbi:hypothetical protein IAT40_000219 [Kwoniella sp. CBS 6097]
MKIGEAKRVYKDGLAATWEAALLPTDDPTVLDYGAAPNTSNTQSAQPSLETSPLAMGDDSTARSVHQPSLDATWNATSSQTNNAAALDNGTATNTPSTQLADLSLVPSSVAFNTRSAEHQTYEEDPAKRDDSTNASHGAETSQEHNMADWRVIYKDDPEKSKFWERLSIGFQLDD